MDDDFFSKLLKCLKPKGDTLYVDGWAMKKVVRDDPKSAALVASSLLIQIKNEKHASTKNRDADTVILILATSLAQVISEELSDDTYIKEIAKIMPTK